MPTRYVVCFVPDGDPSGSLEHLIHYAMHEHVYEGLLPDAEIAFDEAAAALAAGTLELRHDPPLTALSVLDAEAPR